MTAVEATASDTAHADALQHARALAAAGVPLFVAPPADTSTGFALPNAWPTVAQADPAIVDQWRPGWALCAVMGHGVDVLDLDPRNNDGAMPVLPDDVMPPYFGGVFTPSGGAHLYIPSLRVRKVTGLFPAVDLQAGINGDGHGFVFLPPTVKLSKVTNEPAAYRWGQPLDLPALLAAEAHLPLIQAVGAYRSAGKTSRLSDKPDTSGMSPELAAYLTQGAPVSPQRADQAIAAKLAEVRGHGAVTGAGFRTTLMAAAMTLGGYVGAGHLDEASAGEALAAAVADVWGQPDSDDMLWIEQGLRDGAERPFSVAEPTFAPPPPPAVPYDPRRPFGAEPFVFHGASDDQDIADAALARAVRGARVLWAKVSTGQPPWIVRETDHWHYVAEGSKGILQSLRDTMPLGSVPLGKDKSEWAEEQWQHHARARVLKALPTIAGLMDARVRRPGHFVVVRPEQVDANPAVIWAAGRSFAIDGLFPDAEPEGTPHFHSTKYTPVPGPTPAWDAFVTAMWPEPEVAEWALRVLAVGFTGHSDAVMPVLYGDPGKGKSKFMGRLLDLLGGYGSKASTTLIQPNVGNADVAKAELQGVRLAWLDEGLGTGKASVEAVKDITGGGAVYAAAKYRAPVQFNPTHTLVLTTNNEPEIHDEGLARRARIIPCDGDAERIGRTFDVLLLAWVDEAPAVLARMLGYAADYLRDWRTVAHSAAPAAVRKVTSDLAQEQDIVGLWLAERTRPDEQGTRGSSLYADFREFSRLFPAWERRPMALNTWAKRLGEGGYPVHRRPHNVAYRALALTSGDYSPFSPLTQGAGEVRPVRGGGEVPSGGPSHASTSDNGPIVSSVSPQYPSSRKVEEKGGKTVMGVNNGTPALTSYPSDPAVRASEIAFMGRCPVCNGEPGVTTQGKHRSHKVNGVKCEGSGRVVPGFVTPAQAARKVKVAELAGAVLTLPAAMRRGEEPRSVTLEEAPLILDACLARNGGVLGVDIETNALPQWDPRYAVTSIQLGDWSEGVDLDADDPAQRRIAEVYLREATELNAHSYTADLAPLVRLGVIAKGEYSAMCAKTVDTATRAKLADPHLTGNGDGLKELSGTLLGDRAVSPAAEAAKDELGKAAGWVWKLKPETPESKNGWLQIDKRCATMVRYAISDVLDCTAIRRVLPEPAPAVDERERLAQRVTAVVPLLGIKLDGEAVSEQLSTREPRAAEKLARINALGVDNPDSPKQVTERLTALGATLPRTESGNASGAGDILEKLTAAPGELGELAQTILDYRGDATVLKNMIRPWARSTQGGDSRTYPTIYTLGADTGRMSCVRPNLQQVAREGGMRECLVADPGMKIIAADFSSVEVRVAAALSQDPTLMQFVHEGRDLHGEIAALVFGEGWTKAQRYSVKRIVFGRLYGGGLETLARQAGLSDEVTQRCLDVLDRMTPGLKAWSEGLKGAIKSGMAEFPTYAGRVIHLDTALPHKGPNFAIQGTARELLIDALVRWDAGPYAGGVILPVHDEVVAMVPEAVADEAAAFLGECMTTSLYGVAITAEVDAPVDRWASAA